MAISEQFLKLLVCPDNHMELRAADSSLIDQINEKIRAGQLQNVGGQEVTQTLDGGLIRADNHILYPVFDEIPVLLIDEGINLPSAGLSVDG